MSVLINQVSTARNSANLERLNRTNVTTLQNGRALVQSTNHGDRITETDFVPLGDWLSFTQTYETEIVACSRTCFFVSCSISVKKQCTGGNPIITLNQGVTVECSILYGNRSPLVFIEKTFMLRTSYTMFKNHLLFHIRNFPEQ